MTELEELRLAYAECSRQRFELLAKLKNLQPEPEPVAWAKFSEKGNIVDLLSEPDHEYVPLYEIEEWLRNLGLQFWENHDERSLKLLREHPMLYTAPQPTPDHIKAMQQALEALNSFDPYDDFACLWKQTADVDIDAACTALQSALKGWKGCI